MKKAVLLLTAVLLLAGAGLGGCGTIPENILEQYKDYSVADDATNKAGLSIGKVEFMNNNYMINMPASHPAIGQSEENVEVIAQRLQVADAENPDTKIDFEIVSVSATTTVTGKPTTQQFYPAIRISKDIKAKFVIVYFEGISKDEAEDLETKPLFFIVELNKKDPKLLTKEPLLAGGLFE
jgi:hypothetical protein